MRLCFGFVLQTVDNTVLAKQCSHKAKAFSTPHLHPTSKWTGGAQGIGTGHSHDSWPQLIKRMSQTIRCHA